jgi:hypothetical protein
LVGYREALSSNYLANARTDAIGVLERSGISVKEEILPQDGSLTPLSMERDRAQEAKAAAALLGTADESEQGGVTVYTGEKGTARFSRSGEFSAVLNANAYPLGDQTVGEHALATLALLDFEGEIVSTQEAGTASRSPCGSSGRARRCIPARHGAGLTGAGRWSPSGWAAVPGSPGPRPHPATPRTSQRSGAGALSGGDQPSGRRVHLHDRHDAGYVFTAGISDPITLRPVWYITPPIPGPITWTPTTRGAYRAS